MALIKLFTRNIHVTVNLLNLCLENVYLKMYTPNTLIKYKYKLWNLMRYKYKYTIFVFANTNTYLTPALANTQGAVSIQRCRLNSIGICMLKIRQSHDRLILRQGPGSSRHPVLDRSLPFMKEDFNCHCLCQEMIKNTNTNMFWCFLKIVQHTDSHTRMKKNHHYSDLTWVSWHLK